MTSSTAPPPRGTRPRNRRGLIRAAATDLFTQRGYANTSMADVAAAVNVGPSAVYRHYHGKVELLFDVIDTALEGALAVHSTHGGADLFEIACALATASLDNRGAGVLMQREARYLAPDAALHIRRKRDLLTHWLAEGICTRRPYLSAETAQLLAFCALVVLTSISFHHINLPRPAYDRLLGELATRVMLMEPPQPTSDEAARSRPKASTRAGEILNAATDLFAKWGYNTVSIDDIGARVGVGGTAMYNHFTSKQDILNAAMTRGRYQLRAAMDAACSEGTDATDTLRRLSDSYVDQVIDHPSLFGTLITELVHLEGAAGQEARRAQLDYIADWVAIALACNPCADHTISRIKVQAAQMMVIDAARVTALRRVRGLRAMVREAAWAIQQSSAGHEIRSGNGRAVPG